MKDFFKEGSFSMGFKKERNVPFALISSIPLHKENI